MFLKHTATQNLVEILALAELWDPFCIEVSGRLHAGEEMQDPEIFSKAELIFPSGESLPACWVDPQYREHQTQPVHRGAILIR